MKVWIKRWFFNKIRMENGNLHLFNNGSDVVKETEKAYMLAVAFDSLDGEYDGFKNIWVPKSCTLTESEAKAEDEEADAKFKAACDAYNDLVDFAKKSGIKGVRVGMKAATIRSKLAAAGIQY